MTIIDTNPHVLSNLRIDLISHDLEQRIKTSGTRAELLDSAQRTLAKIKTIWQPKAVYRWCEFKPTGKDNMGTIIQSSGNLVDLNLGYSSKFLTHARYVLVSVHTAGKELEHESMNASSKGNQLEAYFIDLIGLLVLDKVGQTIKEIAEEQASDLGWGVSPFMSPGSINGWALEEQIQLCSLLPLNKINVEISNHAVLSPFKTISSLIGLGPGYDAVEVGTTCQVCSKNEDCRMKQE